MKSSTFNKLAEMESAIPEVIASISSVIDDVYECSKHSKQTLQECVKYLNLMRVALGHITSDEANKVLTPD